MDGFNRPLPLQPEDYTDPACPFCTDAYEHTPPVHPVPIKRILEKLDDCLSRKDDAGAERLLAYWIAEAESASDEGGLFTLHNERMGFYRKNGRTEEAKAEADRTLEIGEKWGLLDRPEGGTALLNAATVYYACGRNGESASLFERAKAVYLDTLEAGDVRLAGLYNNYGLTLCALKRFSEARASYEAALGMLSSRPESRSESAVTYLNLASIAEEQYGLESDRAQSEIADCLEKAMALLDADAERKDGDYAFYYEKCAPSFGRYGYFFWENALKERARSIYERD